MYFKIIAMNEIGNKIRARRKELRLSQKQLALLVGVNHTAVSQWETGINKPKTESFAALATGLNLSLKELWPELEGNGVDHGTFIDMVKQTYIQLSDEKRRELLNLLISLGVGAESQNPENLDDPEKQ